MKILIKNIHSIDASYLSFEKKPDFMDDIRFERMQKLKNEADKKRSLASGYLLNEMCKELRIENPTYGYSAKGKPYINGYENIAFNISHSGDYVVLVYDKLGEEQNIAGAREAVGIDVQQIRSLHKGMKKRILHENEQIPEGLLTKEENDYLNRLWAIKESYVKMTGDGLALDFRKIKIDFVQGIVTASERANACFAECHELPGYVIAVCTTGPLTVIENIYK